MSRTHEIAFKQDCSLEDLVGIWAAIPQQAHCLVATIDKAKLTPAKPQYQKLDHIWEARCFWRQHEVYWRKVQQRDQAGLKHCHHVVLSGHAASFPSGFEWQQVAIGNPGQFFISKYFQIGSAFEVRRGKGGGEDVVAVPFVPLKTEDGAIYQQWQPLKFKEPSYDKV